MRQAPTTEGTKAKRGRRPNPERKAATRDRLLDAAVASLTELGYSATTTTEVVERSGLSRGALFSHFPSRDALMAAVAERAVADLGRLYDVTFSSAVSSPSREPRSVVAVQILHEITKTPTMRIVNLLFAEATTDPALRAVLEPIAEANFAALLERARKVLPDLDENDATLQAFLVMWFCLLGLAAQAPVYVDARAEGLVLAALRGFARTNFLDSPTAD